MNDIVKRIIISIAISILFTISTFNFVVYPNLNKMFQTNDTTYIKRGQIIASILILAFVVSMLLGNYYLGFNSASVGSIVVVLLTTLLWWDVINWMSVYLEVNPMTYVIARNLIRLGFKI